MKLKVYVTVCPIWFQLTDCASPAMKVEVECINGSLVNAQRVWDQLAMVFHMVNTRP